MARRVLAIALLFVFLAQSSGAASVVSVPGRNAAPSFLAQITLAFGNTAESLRETYIGAILTGNASRWSAMHAPAPRRASIIPLPRPVIHFDGYGVRRTAIGVWGVRISPARLIRPINPRYAAKDPRALAASARKSKIAPAIIGHSSYVQVTPSSLVGRPVAQRAFQQNSSCGIALTTSTTTKAHAIRARPAQPTPR